MSDKEVCRELCNLAVGAYLGKLHGCLKERDEKMLEILNRIQAAAYAEGRKDQAEACANPLPAATVQRIWDKCQALDLDRVAFAWHVQRECARAG